MPKRPISLTLEVENLTWLKGRAGAARGRSVSALVDTIVSRARLERGGDPARSVAGTIDIHAGDPLLDKADAVMRGVFAESLARPIIVREPGPAYRTRRPAPGKRRG